MQREIVLKELQFHDNFNTSFLDRCSSFVNKLSQLDVSFRQPSAVVGNESYLDLLTREKKSITHQPMNVLYKA